MTAGSGITYESAQDLVEKIVALKKNKYSFPNVESEDLAQDIRLICWDTLKNKFDPNKLGKSVFHFLARVIDYALYNKFRGVYLDNNPPCLRCPEYIKETKECAIDEVGCDRIVTYRQRMARKRAIAAPLSYHSANPNTDDDDILLPTSLSEGSVTGMIDLDHTIRHALDEELLPYYEKMTGGDGADVPPHLRKIIQRQVRIIMDKEA